MVRCGKKRRCTLKSPRLTHLAERTYGTDAQALEPVAWKTALTGVGSLVESGLAVTMQSNRQENRRDAMNAEETAGWFPPPISHH